MLPVFSENIGRPSQSRQRCVIVLCLIFDWTLKLPHFGQCAGKVGTKAPEPAPPSLYLPGSHGTGWSPDYSHAAILCRSRQVTGMFVPGADTMERILERWPLGA